MEILCSPSSAGHGTLGRSPGGPPEAGSLGDSGRDGPGLGAPGVRPGWEWGWPGQPRG